ncbi:hypothetical protein C1646_753768 [Rhizophagus diaphanus]|nr:hypothetical protein C1646_753768 [Rhizophagus diaphanus] [Rhizophagus sp. MUCL 43196]
MSQIFILAFVLFTTLFAVNAAPLALEKRDTQIQPCPGLPPGVVELNVTVTPDPVVPGTEETFDIKGTMKKDIVTGDFLSITFIDNVTEQPIGDPLVVDICSLPGATCPTKAGTAFSTTQKYTAPKELPTSYAIGIGIGHHVQPPNVEPIACEIVIVRVGYSEPKEYIVENENSNIKGRNQKSQRCNCSFHIRASLDSSNGLCIPDDVKQRIALLYHAGVDVLTIRAIINEEFGDCIIWVYNDIYNFIYQLEDFGSEKKEFDAEEFIKVLEQFKYDNDEYFIILMLIIIHKD